MKNASVYKDVLRRLETLELIQDDPVKISYLFRLPDGTEQQKRIKEGSPGMSLTDIRQWEEETGAKMIDVIISVRD